MSLECMEQRELLLLQTILELDMILSVGLTRLGHFGSLEGLLMVSIPSVWDKRYI